jgi:hypothetical protein
MKKLLFTVLLLSVFNIANAEVYLLVDKSTNEIKDLSPENDAVVSEECEKIILKGKLSDYPLEYHPTYYKYQGKKFIVNIKKISDEELAREEESKINETNKLIKEKMEEQAVIALKAEGKLDAKGKIVK